MAQGGLKDSLLNLKLEEKKVEFLIENGKRFLEKPQILAKKLKISQDIALKALSILKHSTLNTERNLTPEDFKRIEKCLSEYPEIDCNEDIALLCEIDEELVQIFFEHKPLTEKEKENIQENYNKNISVENISKFLKIDLEKVKDYIETTFITFTGGEGRIVFEIIRKNFGEIPVSILREKIRSKNLKLQDQLCCKLQRSYKDDYETVHVYFNKYDESKEFLKVDLEFTMDEILIIKQGGKDNVEQLSTKLNKVETSITDYMHQYYVNEIERSYYSKLQNDQLDCINLRFGAISFSSNEYRMIITESFDDIVNKAEESWKLKKSQDLLTDLSSLVFYYLKCSLPFEDIARIIANLSDITLTTHDVFHLIFQLSDPVLKGFCIEHYSFSNAVPLYYPKLKHSSGKPENTKFEFCKELWYCLEQYNGLISLGLGRASWNAVGKSSLLDMIFETDFVKGSPQGSAFHFGSIDIQIARNIFGESNLSSKESTKWAYIDCHRYSKVEIIEIMCSYLDVAIIHVCFSDYEYKRAELNSQLSRFRSKHLYLLIRDSDGVEVVVSEEENHGDLRTVVKIPDLTRTDIKFHSIVNSLKKIGYEIFHLNIKNPKNIDSQFLENVLEDLHLPIVKEIQADKQLIEIITNHIDKTTKLSNRIDFSFLNFYPTFVDYMSKYYQASFETDQTIIDVLNADREQLHEKMNNTPKGDIVTHFNDILQRKNSILILWKLSQELYYLSNLIIPENTETNGTNPNDKASIVNEQKNDKYTLEIIWREALLSQKYGQDTKRKEKDQCKELFSSNFSKQVGSGEAFELIDGDNLRFFNKEIDGLLLKFYEKQNGILKKVNKGKEIKIKPAPIVVSIFGPQSSGKSTLLNYCFGCKFLTSAGRCTRGIYGSLSKLDQPVNLSDSILILDTEGLDAIERENIKDTSMIHFDRTMVLFCLSVSQVVIINVKGDIGSELQNLLHICAFSLNRLKVNKVKAPKIFFVLNQQADPDPNKHLKSINLLMEKLNSESGLETEGVKISDLIQVSRENLFILPSAFNSQQMNKPGAKLFDSNVIKLSPTIAFADKCSKLRLAIIDQLNLSTHESPFETMSEWMAMAGTIWDIIIKYQDIVKYRNVEELMCKNKLNELLSNLMDTHFYRNKKEFMNLAIEICKEIKIDSYLEPEQILKREMIKFNQEFSKREETCLKEFSDARQSDSLLKKMRRICDETVLNINRLIYVVRKEYEDQLKLEIKSILIEIKISESMKNFQEAIIEHVDKYLEYAKEEQIRAFEDTWNETFGVEDQKEEIRELKENFSDLYSIFKMEYNAMENKSNIYMPLKKYNFDIDVVIQKIKEDLLLRFQCPNANDHSDQLTYSVSGHHIPIKDMLPYNGRSEYNYLCRDSLYKMDETWYSSKLHTFVKFTPAKWIPSNCHSLVKYCSGLENHPDIHWKPNKSKQITILTSKLKNPSNLDTSTWNSFIEDIESDTLQILLAHPHVSHAVVKTIIQKLCFRIRLLNYEIGYIQAGLSDTAERMLSTFIFSYAFKFQWEKKVKIRQETISKENAKKQDLLQYFLQKIQNRRMVRGSWNRDKMTESDRNFSEKYANDYIASVKRSLIKTEEYYLKKEISKKKEFFSHENILFLAEELVSKELLKDSEKEVGDHTNIAVQFICNRNELLLKFFDEEWNKLATQLYGISSDNIKMGFRNNTMKIRSVVENLDSELDNIVRGIVSFKGIDSDSNFELAEPGSIDPAETKEIPFKAMNKYFMKYLDPKITPEKFNIYVSSAIIDGLRVKQSDTYALHGKPTEPILDDTTFRQLSNTGMFNPTELIFNLHTYVKQFNLVLKQIRIELTQEEFDEMIAPLKSEFEKDMIGCPSQCPSCGKFCEREIHTNNGKCRIKTGHQISSMGGRVWNNDDDHTAILSMCDDYDDNTQVSMPGYPASMEWGEFKNICSEWDWTLPTEEKFKLKQISNQERMKNIWNKFGHGILKYYSKEGDTKITFIPYIIHEGITQSLISAKLNICFVIDGTSSMHTKISRTRDSVGKLIKKFTSRGSVAEFRVVIYRDHCDDKIIETCPNGWNSFTPQQDVIEDFLSTVKASGGGDFPEAVLDGLATAAKNSDWILQYGVRNKVIHIYDAPPHGDFPNYKSHRSDSNKVHCCCCNQSLCKFDWDRDVWGVFRQLNIEYHGINTSSSYPHYESMMKEKLGDLCGKFQEVGEEVVSEAILSIFVDYKEKTPI